MACSPTIGAGTPSSTVAPTTSRTTAATTSVPVGTTRLPAGCPEDTGFVEAGRVMRVDQPTSDTGTLGLISWAADDGCERLTVEFETTEGAPATTPPTVVVDFLESRQILRAWTDLDSTVVTDQLLETSLVDRLFVVRDLDGGMFLDLHLKGPVRARAVVSNSPARLTLEIEPGAQPFVSTAFVTGNVVVITPGAGTEAVAGAALDVTGYARTFEASVLVMATVGDRVVSETTTTAGDSRGTWGEFRTSIRVPPGELSLFVGEESLTDGSGSGATINLTVR